MQQNLQQKKKLVEGVFNKVFDKYDLINDFMSLGIHRIWKKNFVQMMNPSNNKKLIDVGFGTGDIASLYIKDVNSALFILFFPFTINIIYFTTKSSIILFNISCP